MSTKVAQIRGLLAQDDASKWVSQLWDKFNQQRQDKVNEWLELRNYIFATDTKSTSNESLPWKNSTTTPKLCQIRDNLHSNYISALFPNDSWLSWQAYTKDDAKHQTAKVIEGYMENKCRESHFRTVMSKLLYDYIDYGNSFATQYFEAVYKTMPDGTKIPQYIGPRAERISPTDLVYDPMAESFDKSYKVRRFIYTIGELERKVIDEPGQQFWQTAIDARKELVTNLGGYSYEDFQKACAYSIDGFGNMYEYFMGPFVEVLEFYGDYSDSEGNLKTNRVITIVDRRTTVRDEQMPEWIGGCGIHHVGWRLRPDNLWAMGPLDNLVGMQYRIDHLENAKADAFDLMVQPPLVIQGDVEEFEWGPSAEIYCGEGGSVAELGKNFNAVAAADNQITLLENKMELYAGAPRDAMGIRTPGEKTAFEVQQLQTAAGRIFQEKITQFEVELLEPLLNAMLEVAKRNLDGSDVIRVMDDDYNAQLFVNITRDDITANGILRPVGARHFAKQQQDLQNLIGVFSSPVGQMIAPHTSAIGLTKFINDVIGLDGYTIFAPNIAVDEQHDTQTAINASQEDQQVANAQPLPTQ